MKFADRLKFTATYSAGVLTVVAAASADCRTPAQVINDSANDPKGIKVGDTNVPFVAVDGAGHYEAFYATITSTTQITRTRTVSSSNSGAAVSFAGTVTVFNTALGDNYQGLTDADDPGFDIILLAGQSNMCGRDSSDSTIDFGDGRLFQWNGTNAIISGADPLYQAEGLATGKVGPGTWIAKAYIAMIAPHRRVLLVPAAVGGTAIINGNPPVWNAGSPGGSGYEGAISRANAAIAAAQALYPSSRFVGTAWHQGETDADGGITQAAYAAALKAVIAGFRSRITGAANSWFVIGQMCPDVITSKYSLYHPIDLAHQQVAVETNKCVFATGPTGYQLDSWHYKAQGARILGTRMGLAIRQAMYSVSSDITPPIVGSASVADATPTIVSLAMSEPLDSGFVPAVSAFTVTGHTVSSVAVSLSTIQLTLSAAFTYADGQAKTVNYVQPASNGARDLSGNLLASFATPLTVSNGVAQPATGLTLTGPTGGQVSVASSVFTVGVTPAGSKVSNTTTVTPSDGGAGGTFSPATVQLAVGINSTGTFTYTPSATPQAISITASASGLTASSAATYTSTTAPSETLTVNTPAAQTVGVAFNVTGTYANGVPAALDYALDGGTTWNPATSPTISGGSFTFSITISSANAAQTVKVRDHTVTSAVATSNAFSVSAAAASSTTWSPTDKSSSITLSNGNLTASGGGWASGRATTGKSTGKWYWEVTVGSTPMMIGAGMSQASTSQFPGFDQYGWGYYSSSGAEYRFNNVDNTYSSYAAGDTIGIALDLDSGTIRWYKNGVAQGAAAVILTAGSSAAYTAGATVYPMLGLNSGGATANFGATAFKYTPPTGFSALP